MFTVALLSSVSSMVPLFGGLLYSAGAVAVLLFIPVVFCAAGGGGKDSRSREAAWGALPSQTLLKTLCTTPQSPPHGPKSSEQLRRRPCSF